MQAFNIRNHSIDILRGIAILVVMVLHFHISYGLDQSVLNQIFSTQFIKSVAFNGNYGVTIFFVISGFLITSTSLKRYGSLSHMNILHFYSYRFARIMPCLLLMLGLIVLFNFLHISIFQNDPNTTSLVMAIFSVLTFWHNVLMEVVGYFNYCLNILWSLSVEEIFYLMFPLICLSLKKDRWIIFSWLLFIIMGPIYRNYHATNEIVALYGYFSCFDAIAMGCIAAVISQKMQLSLWIRRIILPSSILLMIVVYLYNGIMQNVIWGISMMAAGTALFLICVDSINTKNISSNRLSDVISWFGKNSYELYLFHIIVLALMKEMIKLNGLNPMTRFLTFLLFLFLSAFVAGMISTFYSNPMNVRLKRFFFNFRKRDVVIINKSIKSSLTQ